MKFSIIVPSFNQDKYIAQTLENISLLKKRASEHNINIEVLLFDSESNSATQDIINSYSGLFDYLEIKKDKGQYDAINKGIEKATGDYWTWLNTDDLIEIEGFLKLVEVLKDTPADYVYGSIRLVNGEGDEIGMAQSVALDFKKLVNNNPGIYQPGSFFRKAFTDKIGLLEKYECCFDYEYVLRAISNHAKLYTCSFIVANFRLHKHAKTQNITIKFVKEQLLISRQYGRRLFSTLTFIAVARLLKHRLLGTYYSKQ